MAFNGSGVHNRVHDWTQDLANTIPVTASRMDAEHDDMSGALSNCICRDGQSTTTARIPFAAGVSAAAGSTSAVAYAQTNDPNTGLYFPGADQVALVAGGAAVLNGTNSGVAINGAHTVTGTQSVSGNATFGGTLAAAGDITHHGQPIVPIGAIVDFAGTLAPNGWLFCYGQAISRSTYAALFGALGTAYGPGDGSTTFNLPDLRGRVVAGKDDMGGSSANRLTNQSGGLNGDTLGASGGAETNTLTTAQVPATGVSVTASQSPHEHFIANSDTGPDGGNGISGSNFTRHNAFTSGFDGSYQLRGTDTTPTLGRTSAVAPTITASGTVQGGGSAHNNVQPTIILNKMIFTGIYA